MFSALGPHVSSPAAAYCGMAYNSEIAQTLKSTRRSLCSSCDPQLILGVTPAIDVRMGAVSFAEMGHNPACPGWATLLSALQTWWLWALPLALCTL